MVAYACNMLLWVDGMSLSAIASQAGLSLGEVNCIVDGVDRGELRGPVSNIGKLLNVFFARYPAWRHYAAIKVGEYIDNSSYEQKVD